MSKPSTLDKFRDRLFDDIDRLELTDRERSQLMRYRAIFVLKLENPHITNANVVKFLNKKFGIRSIAEAYRDIAATETMLGKVRTSEKQWIRYLVTETLKEAIDKARRKGDLKNMVAAADKLGKYSRLDQEDPQPLPYEDIVPSPIEYLNDPSILGLPTPKEGARAYIERIKRKYVDVQDVEYEDVKRGE